LSVDFAPRLAKIPGMNFPIPCWNKFYEMAEENCRCRSIA
jgi:hypothetical protein